MTDDVPLQKWKNRAKKIHYSNFIKTGIRFGIYGFAVYLSIIAYFGPYKECKIEWITKTQSVVDVQSTLNLVPCDRGYDLYNPATYTTDFIKNDPCSKDLILTLDNSSCPDYPGGILPGPNYLFVDIPLEGYLRTDLGKKTDLGEFLDDVQSVQIPECHWRHHCLPL